MTIPKLFVRLNNRIYECKPVFNGYVCGCCNTGKVIEGTHCKICGAVSYSPKDDTKGKVYATD